MTAQQTAYAGDSIKILINVVDSTGSHVVAVIDTSTTRLNGYSTVPTVNTINTGIYEIVFSGVTPAPSEGDRLVCKVNGAISGVAWSEYAIPVLIVADERGTDSVVVPTADITAIKTKTDQLTFSVANQVDANSLTGGTSPADIWSYATRTITSGGITASEVTDAVWDASYSSHVLAGTFGKLMDQLRKANRAIDGEVSGTPTVSAFDSNLTGYATGAFDSEILVFVSGPLEGEARPILTYNATNGRLTFEEHWTGVPNASDEFVILPQHVHSISEIASGTYSEFISGSNEDAFKADISGLASQASVDTIDTNVDAVKIKTDQFVFTVPNQVDANSLTGGLSESQVRDAVGLASANLDIQLADLPTSAEIATEILAAGDVDGYSLEETLKLCLAALAGKISGAGSGTVTIRSADDSANRIVATTDNLGNRLSITIDEAG